MRVLKARFRETKEFVEAFDAELPAGGIFCPTTQALEVGEEVVVELNFPDLPNKMMLRGNVVSWRAALPRLRVRAGALVAFAEDEVPKRDFILQVAAGDHPGAVKRRHARLPIERPVSWRRANEANSREGTLREISIGGAQLVTDEALERDEDILIDFTTPGGARPISIASKVTYNTPTGYGLRFVYRDGGGSRRLREMVRRLIDVDTED